jgi:hypothetical protein
MLFDADLSFLSVNNDPTTNAVGPLTFVVNVKITVGSAAKKKTPPPSALVRCCIVLPSGDAQTKDDPNGASMLPTSGAQERDVTVSTPDMTVWPDKDALLSVHLIDPTTKAAICSPVGGIHLTRQ